MALSGEEMSGVLNQDTFLWLYGVVAFADVRGTQWETEFCFRYDDGDSLSPYSPQLRAAQPNGVLPVIGAVPIQVHRPPERESLQPTVRCCRRPLRHSSPPKADVQRAQRQ